MHSPEVQEVAFAEFSDGTLAEVIEHPHDPSRTQLAIAKRGRVRFVDRFERDGKVIIPISRSAVGFSEIKLPSGVLPCPTLTKLAAWIFGFLKCAVDVSRLNCFVLAAFVLYTWLADRLQPAVYLSVIGLPQSGKSTLLELLSMICRQPLLVADISEAAITATCSRFNPTLLIDEIEWRSSKDISAFRQLLRAGTARYSQSLRVRGSASAFGPKVFSSLEPSTDLALNSRCLQITMVETSKSGLSKPGHPSMVAFASDLRRRLLNFRFRSYHSVRLARLPGLEELRPRSRDLFACLSAPLAGCKGLSQCLLTFFRSHHDPSTREALSTLSDGLVAAIFELLHQGQFASVRVKFLTEATNQLLHNNNERAALTDRAVGSMLSSLGFQSKKRTNQGWILVFDSETEKRAHQLFKTHGVMHLRHSDLERYAKNCPTCKTFIGTPNR